MSCLALVIATFTFKFSWKITFLKNFYGDFWTPCYQSIIYQIFMGTGQAFSSKIKFKVRYRVKKLTTTGGEIS